jgi:hypothetical protein
MNCETFRPLLKRCFNKESKGPGEVPCVRLQADVQDPDSLTSVQSDGCPDTVSDLGPSEIPANPGAGIVCDGAG